MTLREISLKRAYSSDTDDILQNFYVPALQSAVEYHRLAGFFSSSSLAVAAREVVGLIENGGSMGLVACPKLTEENVRAILTAEQSLDDCLVPTLMTELDRMEEEFVRDHVGALVLCFSLTIHYPEQPWHG